MHKMIAVFTGDVTSSLQEIVIKKIISQANELGYDTAFICTYGSYNEDLLYSEGERAFVHLADYSTFDGMIILEDLLDIEGMADELYKEVITNATCPIVYFRTIREGCYSVLTHNTRAMETMTRHFIVDHGFTDICYMSGKPGHLDTTERLQGFLNVMKEYKLPINKHTVFHGDYWREKGAEALDWFMEGRDKYPQAIICANDYMALSICDELTARGYKVPEDVCVSGFDYLDEARNHKPSLTSIEVDFEAMAGDAVKIIDRVNRGEEVERFQYTDPKIHYHNSCCGEQVTISNISKIIEDNYLHTAAAKRLMLSITEYQDCFVEDEYFRIADKYHSIINVDNVWVCMCDTDENGFSEVENDTKFSNQMVLKRRFFGDKSASKMNEVFERRNLLPDSCWPEDKYNNYLFFCLHYKNKVYGYVAIDTPTRGWFQIYMQAYYVNLANAIEDAYIQKELANLEEIRALYHKDPLTGIYNRRGFDKFLRERYETFKETKVSFGIASIDLDGLKYINDTFGHPAGDKAITLVAHTLDKVMLDTEFCGRVGGDEFSALIDTQVPGRIDAFKADFYKEIAKVNENLNSYTVGASIGICDLAENPLAPLSLHLKKADIRMYENKRMRKASVR